MRPHQTTPAWSTRTASAGQPALTRKSQSFSTPETPPGACLSRMPRRVARTDLRGPRCSNASGLPGCAGVRLTIAIHRVAHRREARVRRDGVLVVPQRHRVYATATGANQMITIDEDTGQQLAQAPTGDYPDGLAYDPDHHTIWTTNESGGSETVIDADTGQAHGTVPLGGE